MGFFSKQFIDVIDWVESEDGVLSYKFPFEDNEIQNGGQLTVRESQMALFVDQGRIADQFAAGRYTLGTQTLPILTNLKNWDKAFKSPFKSDVYFFSTRDQMDLKWGTAQPITVRDPEMGAIRMRAFGNYSFALTDPRKYFKAVAGTKEISHVKDLEGQLRSGIVTGIASTLGGGKTAFLDLAGNQSQLSETLLASLAPQFDNYGLKLKAFFVQSISLPEEIQPYLDKAAGMRMLDLNKYVQFQSAEAMVAAANNPGGGAAGAGVGLGAGLAMGQMMGQAFKGASGGGGGGSETPEGDPLALIDQLHGLLTKGILSQAEFDTKKAELLKRVK
jgi:membrane protease subunit (stomatin/prohibitin family)